MQPRKAWAGIRYSFAACHAQAAASGGHEAGRRTACHSHHPGCGARRCCCHSGKNMLSIDMLMLMHIETCAVDLSSCMQRAQGTFSLPADVAPALAGLVHTQVVVFRLLPKADASRGQTLEVCLSPAAFADEAEGPPLGPL